MSKLRRRRRRVEEGTTVSQPEPRGPSNCGCANCITKPRSRKGGPGCEYFNHHCDFCHDKKICTTLACLEAFAKPDPTV